MVERERESPRDQGTNRAKAIAPRKYFEKFDALLDGHTRGPRWLGNSSIAEAVKATLHSGDGHDYDLLAYCLMPNHVHLVLDVGRTLVRPLWNDNEYGVRFGTS